MPDIFDNPTLGPPRSGIVPHTSLFLEYVTGRTAGWSRIESGTITNAVAEATRTLRGLECVSAALRRAPAANYAFGAGTLLAAYTPLEGWRVHEDGSLAGQAPDISSPVPQKGPSPGDTEQQWPRHRGTDQARVAGTPF